MRRIKVVPSDSLPLPLLQNGQARDQSVKPLDCEYRFNEYDQILHGYPYPTTYICALTELPIHETFHKDRELFHLFPLDKLQEQINLRENWNTE
jgi:hypothetical protein